MWNRCVSAQDLFASTVCFARVQRLARLKRPRVPVTRGEPSASRGLGLLLLLAGWLLAASCCPLQAQAQINGATFSYQRVATAMVAGQTYPVIVTLQNSGTSTWNGATAAPFGLGAQNPTDNTTWVPSRLHLPTGTSVTPGQSYSFAFNVTAPATAGTYHFQWQMVQDGVGWFGDTTPDVVVTVAASVPASVPPSGGLALWLKADAGVTKNANNYVSAWADPMTTITASQATAKAQPLWVDKALNGQPVLRFNGVWDLLQTPTIDLLGSTGNDFSLFIVARPGYSQSQAAFILDYDHYQNNGFMVTQPYQEPPNQWATRWFKGGALQGPESIYLKGNVPTIYAAIKNGGIQSLYKDGALATAGGVPATMDKAPHILVVGGELGYPYAFNGDIAEILIYNQTLTETQRLSINDYLDRKYFTPVNLQAAPVSTGVTLRWTWTPGSTGYNVKRATSSGGPYSFLATTAAASYTDTTAAAATTYYYVVSANRPLGETNNSTEASATSQASPAVPKLLSLQAATSQVTLTWTACAGATSYKVKRATVQGGPYTVVGAPTTTSYADTGLRNGTCYFYVVSAVSGGVESANSGEGSAVPQAVPTAPTDLTATAGDAKVLLEWTASDRAVTYQVWRSAEGATWSKVATVNVATYTDTGLTNGVLYSYYVQAFNSSGGSVTSSEVSVMPEVLSTLAPGTPAFSTRTATSIKVLGPALPFRATSLTLQRAAGGSEYSQTYVDVATGLGDHTATTVTGLTPNASYAFRYVAVGTGGNTPGNAASTTTLPPAPAAPEAPLFSAVTNSDLMLYSPALPEWAQSFTVQQKLQGQADTAYTDYSTGLGSTSNVTVSGLSAGTAYTFRLVAVGTGGSVPGAAANVTTAPVAPGAPSFTNVTSSSMTVTAPTLPTGATTLTLQQQVNSLYFNVATGLAGGATTNLTGLVSSGSYTFRYLAVGSGGSTPGTTGYQSTPTGTAGTPRAPGFSNITGTSVDVTPLDSLSYYSGATWKLQQKLQSDPDTAYTDIASITYSTTTSVTGLSAGTSYSFRYVVVGGSAGPAATLTTATSTPGVPSFSNVTATGFTVTAPALPTGASSLSLERQAGYANYNPSYIPVATGLAAGAQTTFSGLTPNTTYTFCYAAVNTGGNSLGSTASVTTSVALPSIPEAPIITDLLATTLTVNVPAVPPDATSLTLQQKLQADPDTAYANVATGLDNYSQPVSVTGLTAQTSYSFRMVAVGSGGSTNGPAATVTTPPPAPGKPGTPSFSNVGQTTMTVTMPALPTNATSLSLQQATGYYANTFADVATGKAGNAVFQVVGLSPSTYYTFRVVAVGAGGSMPGDNAGVQTDNGAPPAPGAPHFSNVTEDSVLVSPPAFPDGANSMTLQSKYHSQPNTAYVDLATIYSYQNAAERQTPVNGLDRGVSYDFRYVATAYGGSTPGAVGTIQLPTPSITWGAGTPISCAGIRYPADGQVIQAGHEGRVSSFLATDWDDRYVTVNGRSTVEEYSDPCSYTWSASGGSFKNGINTGESPVWIAPTTPGTYTITLVVDDQNGGNQPANQGGTRNDAARGYNDDALHFSITVTVQ